MKGRKWNANSKYSRLKHKRRYPKCQYVKHLTETIAEVRAATNKDPIMQRRRNQVRYMRLKRFKANPDKYRAIRLAKANGGKSEDYLGQPTVDISGQSEGSSELSLATESDFA